MPILSSIAGAAAKAYGMMSGVKRIFDYFTRTTSGSLGTSTSGDAWEATRGVWSANGSQATTATTASNYPIAAVNFTSPNATINLDVSDGSGAAFWITDAQNWWGLASTSSISGNVCVSGYTNYSAPFSYGGTAASYGSEFSGYTQTCTAYGIFQDYGEYYQICTAYVATPTYTQTYSAGTPATYVPASYSFYCGSYANTYNYSLTLVKSIANTITTVTTQALSSAAASIRLLLNGESISATGYSSSQQSGSNLGTLTNTATGASRTSKHGIILIPSAQQQTVVDNISIDVI